MASEQSSSPFAPTRAAAQPSEHPSVPSTEHPPAPSTEHPSPHIASGRYAAIDIGTVTCRMLVADISVSHGAIRISDVAKEYAVVNLGEGVDATHRLHPDAIARTIAAIDRYIAIRDALDTPEHPLLGTAVMATSASRDAENAEEFAAQLSSRGLSLLIIPGEREAALSFEGATMEHLGEPVAVVDVGGGSTEISIGAGGGIPSASHSFNIGCRRMTERFLKDYPPTPESIDAAREWVRKEFSEWFESLPKAALQAPITLIAVAGTATSAVSMRDEMETYDSSRVHGATVTNDDLQKLLQRILPMTLPEIEGIVGLDPKRAPVILAGMIILQEAMRALGVQSFIASESDILQGMIMYQAKSRA